MEEERVDHSSKTDSKKSKFPLKGIVWIIVLFLIGYGVFRFVSFYTSPNRAIQQVYLVPKDAILIIQANSPIQNWEQFSNSEPWQCLKQSPSFAKIADGANVLDSIFQVNKQILSLVGKRDLMISVHQIRPERLDFLYIVDLQKLSEVDVLKEQIEQVYSFMNYSVTYRKYQENDIIELRDPKTRDIIYTAFVDNHYIASLSSKLVEAAIDERKNPHIGLDPFFLEADKSVSGKGLCRIYVQQATLSRLLNLYMGKENNYVPIMNRSLTYTGLALSSDAEKLQMKGYAFLKDTIDPYMSALFRSGKRDMTAHKILSDRTAFYTNICFDNTESFVQELEKVLSENNTELYRSYKDSYKNIESMFDISLKEDFLSWMSGEFAISELEPGLIGHDREMILAIRTKDLGLAQQKMEYIEKQVKKNTPVHIKKANYKGYEINYVELKGFFALFFGKMFDKFEKPYYTYVNDYVIFSNKPATILSFIEDYEQERTLRNDAGFMQVYDQAEKESSYFVYMNSIKFYPLMEPLLNQKTWEDLSANRQIVYSFPYSGFQMVGNQEKVSMLLTLNYQPYQEVLQPQEIGTEPEDEEDDISEKAVIDELNRFYAEKFQGNVYREFYQEGPLMSECEIRDGKRDGTYHEYYPSGKLKIRGKYSKDQPKGTWKYYTEEGKLEKKVKM